MAGFRERLGQSVDGRLTARRLDRAPAARDSGQRLGAPLAAMCLPNLPESVPLVRRFIGLLTQVYEIQHVSETAELLVSELTTNTTQHAVNVARRFEVLVYRHDDRLRVEVRDASPVLPVLRQGDAWDEGGRGLLLVETLADGHGAHPMPNGKCVWFELIAWKEA